MSKLIMVALLVGSLVAGAVPAMAQQVQGGIADPLTLAASGVVIPFFTSGILGTTAILQVASPVGNNPDAHMFFFDKTCARIPISVGIPLTTNDIAFQTFPAPGVITAGTDGLITLASANSSGFALRPLDSPVHARLYQFSSVDGRSRVVEPIIVNTAEFPAVSHWWSPLRTGATFYAPPQTSVVQTDLILICPRNTIEGLSSAAFGADPGGDGDRDFTSSGFPQINPRFPSTGDPGTIRVRIYDTNEVFKRDFTINCPCIAPFPSIAISIHPFYADIGEAPGGTYTELTVPPVGTAINAGPRLSFTGYTSTFTVGSPLNAFFARIQGGGQKSLDGDVTNER